MLQVWSKETSVLSKSRMELTFYYQQKKWMTKMPNKNQANIPVQIQTKDIFDAGLFQKMKDFLGYLTYNEAILKLNEISDEIITIFQWTDNWTINDGNGNTSVIGDCKYFYVESCEEGYCTHSSNNKKKCSRKNCPIKIEEDPKI